MIKIIPTWFLSCRHDFYHADANEIERLCDSGNHINTSIRTHQSTAYTTTSWPWEIDTAKGSNVNGEMAKHHPYKPTNHGRSRVLSITAVSLAAHQAPTKAPTKAPTNVPTTNLPTKTSNARAAGPTADRRSSHPPQKQSLAGKKRNTTINQWQ